MAKDDSPQGYSAHRPEGEPGSLSSSPGERSTPPFCPSYLFGTEKELRETQGLHPKVQQMARLLHSTPRAIVTPVFLIQKYLELQEGVLNDEVPEEDAAVLLTRLAETIETLAQSPPISSQPAAPPVDDRLDRLITVAEQGRAATEEVARLIDEQTRGTQSEIARVATAVEKGRVATERMAGVVEEQAKGAEPEIARIEVPGTAEECVALVEARLFSLLQRAITEKKQTKEYEGEYIALQRMIDRIPREPTYDVPETRESRELSHYLAGRFPEGVFLGEKLTLLVEAMKNLTDRTVEVVVAEGSLMKLGVEKPETPLAKEMLVNLTNIEPVNWYVLTRMHLLFPEAANIPETNLDIQAAWDEWRDIGDQPYREVSERVMIDLGKKFKGSVLVEADGLESITDAQGKLVEKRRRGVGLRQLNRLEEEDPNAKLKFPPRLVKEWSETELKEATRQAKTQMMRSGRLAAGYILSDLYRSEAAELALKRSIVEEMGGSEAAIRSELMAWCFLKVGLTFDMWDRERWKIKGDGGARDLMWFPVKQVARAKAARSGEGVLYTAGAYWAFDDQEKGTIDKRLGEKEGKIRDFLRRNREKAVFIWGRESRTKGTIIGDFWSSVTFYDVDGSRKQLSSVELAEIPFLDPSSQVENGNYSGYFGYSLAMANNLVKSLLNNGWEVKYLLSPNWWKSQTDLFVRLPEYCPWMNTAPGDELGERRVKNKNSQNIQKMARFFAEGVLWLGSAEAQPYRDFWGIKVRPRGIYHRPLVRIIQRAIEDASFLDSDNFGRLIGNTWNFSYPRR